MAASNSIRDAAVKAYVASRLVPQVLDGVWIGGGSTSDAGGSGGLSVQATWKQISMATASNRLFTTVTPVQLNVGGLQSDPDEILAVNGPGAALAAVPADPDPCIQARSEDGIIVARIYKKKSTKKTSTASNDNNVFVLEIWDAKGGLKSSVNLTDLDVHGDVYMDSELGGLTMSRSGTLVAYVAEAKRASTCSFFDGFGATTTSSDVGTEADQGQKRMEKEPGKQFAFRDEWGEQMVGQSQGVIVTMDLETQKIRVWKDEFPEDRCPGKLVLDGAGSALFGISVKTAPYRLGLMFCNNRSSDVFKLCLKSGRFQVVSSSQEGSSSSVEKNCSSLRTVSLLPQANNHPPMLLWLERDLSGGPLAPGPHRACLRLMCWDPTSSSSDDNRPKIVVDVVRRWMEDQEGFGGLFDVDLPVRCVVDPETVAFSCCVKATSTIVLCRPKTNEYRVLRHPQGLNLRLLDCRHDDDNGVALMLAEASDPLTAPHLVAACYRVAKEGQGRLPGELEFCKISDPGPIMELPTSSHWAVMDHGLPKFTIKDYEHVRFNSVFVSPRSDEVLPGQELKKKVPLILFPHGGPHAVSTSAFNRDVLFFSRLGYAVLLVNYRGSLGSGQDCVESLLGNVGSSDVSDCHQALQEALETHTYLDKSRVFLFGGSHGGFLSTHLVGQFPDDFVAAVARNPVTNILSMVGVTDIPDWSFNETGHDFRFDRVADNEDVLGLMFKVSPMAHADKIKAPVFLMIGKVDLRVPPSQGYALYRKLKALGKKVKMNVYDDDHSLSKIPVNSDVMVNTAIFFQEASKESL